MPKHIPNNMPRPRSDTRYGSCSDELDKILAEAIAKHSLPKKEKMLLDGKIKEVISRIEQNIAKSRIKAKVILGGSAAKGTTIKGDFDCDIFVAFDLSMKNYNLSKTLFDLVKSFRFEEVHGSRDYYRIMHKGVKYEIIPVLDVKDSKQAVNVTDMSPLHVDWVMSRVRKDPGLTDEMLLSKIFCKAQDLYGAESYIKGFSGHVLDILTMNYGGFIALLKASQSWKKGDVIDVEHHYKAGDAGKRMNSSKTQSPIIVVDPIMPERNAAASLSDERFMRFRQAAASFLDAPSQDFFQKKVLNHADFVRKHKGRKIIELRIWPLDGKDDVVGSKMLKSLDFLKTVLKLNDFRLLDFSWQWKDDPAVAFFVFDRDPLARKKTWLGPPLNAEKNADLFMKKHKETFVDKGRVCALVEREFITPGSLIRNTIKNSYVTERTKRISVQEHG
ncbi:nucleotidyltransferase domain-containing protein [Candidatus Woesearchaeota archaeon]|nr:nucleotidyltransferase domain-containing protein [Candidatus Woesearchaeota archaeon]